MKNQKQDGTGYKDSLKKKKTEEEEERTNAAGGEITSRIFTNNF